MKMTLGVVLIALGLVACAPNNTPVGEEEVAIDVDVQEDFDENEMETDAHVLNSTPEEMDFITGLLGKATAFRFAQTSWNECRHTITGNYSRAACSQNRKISVMLKDFMDQYMTKCVDEGLAAQGGGKVQKFHLVHAGIFGDPNHSPRSLHAENRAIDIKSIIVTTTAGSRRDLVFSGLTHRTFYSAFRKCWGKVLNTYNGCPYVSGGVAQTGTIGWENADHQHHLHTSVPYCVKGQYGSYYYQR